MRTAKTLPARPRRYLPRPQQQTGATLIIGLILLLVLTVLGVSGMHTATMEVQMAGNMQYQQDAFQMAEDAIDIAIGTRDYTTNGPTYLLPTGNANGDRQAVTTYIGDTNVPDSYASSVGVVSAFHFDVVAVGKSSGNATSTHIQSFYVVGRAL